MIQTIAKKASTLPMHIRQRFGTVIFDEVHHLSAATFIKTAPLFYGQRYGLTATPDREDGLEHAYYAHIGQIFYSDLVGELEASVYFKSVYTEVDLGHPDVVDIRGEFCVPKFYSHLAKMRERNLIILAEAKKAMKKGRKILALSHSVQHPEELAKLAKEDSEFALYKVGCVSGKTKGKDRLRIIEESDITFATFQVAKEGLDIVQLDTLFFLTPFKAWGSLQQGKGRIERQFPGKKEPIVIIFNDVSVGPSSAMCRSLMRSLRLNGFKFKKLE
jgi:superfamily II DNA or RNA helicase